MDNFMLYTTNDDDDDDGNVTERRIKRKRKIQSRLFNILAIFIITF